MAEKISILTKLTKEETKIYELAITRGYITISMVDLVIKKGGEAIVQSLVQKGLLKQIKGIVARWIPVPPVNDMIKTIDEVTAEYDKIGNMIIESQKVQKTAYSTLNSDAEIIVKNGLAPVLKNAADARANTTSLVSGKIGDFKKGITDLSQKIGTDIDANEAPSTAGMKKEIDAVISKNEAELKSKIDSETVQLKNVIDTLQKSLKVQQEAIVKNFDVGKGETTKQFEAIKKELKDGINVLAAQTVKSGTEYDTVIKDNILNGSNSVSQSLKTAEETSKNLVLGVMKTAEGIIKTTQDDTKKTVDNSFTEVTGSHQNLVSHLGTSHGTLKEKVQTGTNDLISETNSKITAIKTELNTQTDGIIKKSIEQVKSENAAWAAKMTELMNKGMNTLKDGSSGIKNVISSSIQKEVARYKKEVADSLAKIQSEYLGRIEKAGEEYDIAFKNEINDKVVDFNDILKKTTDDMNLKNTEKTGIQEKQLLQINESIKTNVNTTGDTINEKFKILMKENTTNFSGNLDKVVAEDKAALDKSFTDTLAILKQNSEKLTTQLQKAQENLKNGLTAESAKLLASVDERIAKIKEIADSTLKNQSKIIQDTALKTKTDIETKLNVVYGAIDKANQALAESIDKFNTGISPNIIAVPEKSNEILKPVMGKFTELLATMKNSFTAVAANLESNYSKAIKGSSSSIKQQLAKYDTDVTTTFNKAEETIKSSFEQLGTLTNKATDEITNAIKASIVKVQEAISKRGAEITDSMNKVVTEAKTSTAKPKEILSEVFKEFSNTNLFDAEKTWIIVGQDEIMKYIREMIPRIKSSGFILVPKYEDLNWNEIMDIHAKGRKFLICTNLDLGDVKMLNKAMESGIELYNYSNKDFIAMSRDNEELIIAPIAPQEDDTTAIVSEISVMIQHLSGMFNDYWRRVAKKYMPK